MNSNLSRISIVFILRARGLQTAWTASWTASSSLGPVREVGEADTSSVVISVHLGCTSLRTQQLLTKLIHHAFDFEICSAFRPKCRRRVVQVDFQLWTVSVYFEKRIKPYNLQRILH